MEKINLDASSGAHLVRLEECIKLQKFNDIKLVASDSEYFINLVLLSIHSPLFKSVFQSLMDPTDAVIIIPDIEVSEIVNIVSVMCGVDEFQIVSGSLLETLGLKSFGFQVLENYEGFVDVDSPVDTFASLSDISTGLEDVENEVIIENSEVETITEKDHSDGSGMESIVDEEKTFRCDICSKVFKTKKTWMFHMKAKHEHDSVFSQKLKEISASKSLKISCPLCDQTFTSRNLKNHIRSDHETHTLVEECDICHKKFSNISHLYRHIDSMHNEERRHECTLCDFTTKIKQNLRRHILVHSAEFRFKCDICGHQSKRENDFKKHVCREKTFQCDICNKMCATAEGLKKHKKRNHK